MAMGMEMRLEVLYSRHPDRQAGRRTDMATDTVREGEGNTYRGEEREGKTNDGAKFLANAFSRLINFRSEPPFSSIPLCVFSFFSTCYFSFFYFLLFY